MAGCENGWLPEKDMGALHLDVDHRLILSAGVRFARSLGVED